MLTFERNAAAQGFCRVAGVDEAGRGPLAGPVVAAAVILPPGVDMPGLTDSKKLSEDARRKFYPTIMETAVAWKVAAVEADEIDRINILQATKMAMRMAVEGLGVEPDHLLIDGNQKISWRGSQRTIVKGDSLSLSIAAASVLAKVTRDRIMEEHALQYPVYGFQRHKGYGVAEHLEAIRQHGPSPIHRKTFRGVKEHLAKEVSEKLFGQISIPSLT